MFKHIQLGISFIRDNIKLFDSNEAIICLVLSSKFIEDVLKNFVNQCTSIAISRERAKVLNHRK